MKQCKVCKETKPLDEFYNNPYTKDKKIGKCKKCSSQYDKDKRKTPERQARDIAYRQENKEKIRLRAKQYLQDNKDKKNAYRREYRKRPQVKAQRQASKTIYTLINREHTNLELIGCSFKEFVTHIESLWKEGMSWDNYGFYGWHLDHIRPKSSFDLTNPEEQKKCFHYSNIQPLWAQENLSKGSKYTPTDSE
jgi:hypothetical protein